MTEKSTQVRDHYEARSPDQPDIVVRVAALLADLDAPVEDVDLAAIDQFHFGGSAATQELGRRLAIKPGMTVLDAGSGLGGPSRALASAYGCTIVGVDLAPSYVAVARLLAERSGWEGRVRYDVADLIRLPFADDLFDVVYTQHAMMNVADRASAYRELRRVLKPGGSFGFYDVLAADNAPPPHYPVPWAEDEGTSFLLTEAETRAALGEAGLATRTWSDVTVEAMGWAAAQQALAPNQRGNLGMIMGPRMAVMAANFMRNLAEGRLKLVMAVSAAV